MLTIGQTYGNVRITNRFLTLLDLPDKLDEAIKVAIADFEASVARKQMKVGGLYYETKNVAILDRRKLIYSEYNDSKGKEQYYYNDDPYKSNLKLPSSYYKLAIDQKIDYSLGKPISFESNIDFLSKKDIKQLKKAGKDGSKKSVGWLHTSVDKEGNWKNVSIKPEQCIPLWDMDNEDELEILIRYYPIKVINKDGDFVEVKRVEVWDKEQVSFFEETTDTGLLYLINDCNGIYTSYNCLDYKRFGENPRTHFKENIEAGKTVISSKDLNWGQVPFHAIYSNDEENYDLQTVLNYINVYDFIQSEFANVILDNTAVYWTLKGYDGENLEKFRNQIKAFNIIKVGENGDARPNTIVVPHEAFMAEIDNLENKIAKFLQMVDVDKLAGVSNITNVVIKAMFAGLDLKASQFEEEITEAIEWLAEMYNIFATNTGAKQVELEDITYNRSLIINEVELSQLANASKGSLSETTRLSNDPRVNDAEEEIIKMESEEEAFEIPDDPEETE